MEELVKIEDPCSLQKKFLVGTYVNRGITFVKAEGCYLFDSSGEKYLDLMTNYGVNIFGHSHPYIVERICEQAKRLTTLHCSFGNEIRALSAQKLVEKIGKGLSQVYFSNSGAEAIESALKFAVLATGRKKFVSCYGGYHGKTLGALSATYNQKYRAPFEPLIWEFKFVPYNDTKALEEVLDGSFAGFLIEPIQGESGIFIPSSGYLKEVKKICEEKEVLLILDEIQTGLGRTGSFLASEKEIENYDILCLGKGLAGGLPVGATLVSKEISPKITKSLHTSTFGGNPLVCAGVLSILELITDKLLFRVEELGNYFLERLKELKSELLREVRGRGMMLGMEVKDKRDLILKELQKRRILAIPAGSHVIRFLPPYILRKSHVDECINALQEILNSKILRG